MSSASVNISVVIPYFQRKSGILRHALESILKQNLPDNVQLHVMVVDDGSPISAESEVQGLSVTPPFHLHIIPQANGGVSTARNTGLDAVASDCEFIAFLDSDDAWRQGHVQQAVDALRQGYDFYFCDNARENVHASQFAVGDLMRTHIPPDAQPQQVIALTPAQVSELIVKEFPTQASTVMFRNTILQGLRFDHSITTAGEDKIFFLKLVNHARTACFSPALMVECGAGINIYFGQRDWDSAGHLGVVIDELKSHQQIEESGMLAPQLSRWNKDYIRQRKRKLAFLSLRHLLKKRAWPQEIKSLAKQQPAFYAWFPFYAIQVAFGRTLGLYKPR